MINIADISGKYKKAVSLTLSSLDLVSNDSKPTLTVLRLHEFFMKINPYSLMTPTSISKTLKVITESELKEFFIRLAARFQFQFSDKEQSDLLSLYSAIYDACNVHNPLVAKNGVLEAVNLLGEENAEQQMTREQSIALLAHNRWYTMVCLYILIYDGQ